MPTRCTWSLAPISRMLGSPIYRTIITSDVHALLAHIYRTRLHSIVCLLCHRLDWLGCEGHTCMLTDVRLTLTFTIALNHCAYIISNQHCYKGCSCSSRNLAGQWRHSSSYDVIYTLLLCNVVLSIWAFRCIYIAFKWTSVYTACSWPISGDEQPAIHIIMAGNRTCRLLSLIMMHVLALTRDVTVSKV